MEKEYVVKLDVYLGVLEARVISFNQLNTGTCKLSFELTSNKQALDLTGKKVTFEVTTPSGATLEDAILVTDATQGEAECMLANDMIAEQGMHYAEINVYSKNNTKLLTFNKFRYIVNGQLGAKDITVDTRYSTLQELILEVENLKNQSVIDTETVTQMKNETDLMHKDVIVKHGEVEVKHQEVVTLSQSVKDDASRTASNAQQVSTDKGIVTKAKNEVVAKHDEVLKTAGVIAQDKAIVEQAKTETLGYKNDVEAMKNDVQQLVTDNTEDLILEGNRQVVRVSTEGTTQVNLAKAEVTKATQQATVATEQAGIAQRYAETAQGELSKVTAEGTKQIKAVSDKGVEQVQAIATEGAKQIELAKTEVIKAEASATLATTEADRAGAQAQEKVNNKIGLNGVHDDTNFNFICQNVVQDGLVEDLRLITTSSPYNLETKQIDNKEMTIMLNYFHNGKGGHICGNSDGSSTYGFYIDSRQGKIGIAGADKVQIIDGCTYNIAVTLINGDTFIMYLNGVKISKKQNQISKRITAIAGYSTNSGGLSDGSYVTNCLVYNRQLTPQEIQHNFSVLNNSPSIKELHTTDSESKTSILKLGSDSTHVEMQTGRTLEEEYTSLLSRFGKEFTSADGSAIEVNNAIPSKVLSAEIKGNTVKQLLPTTLTKSDLDILGNNCEILGDGIVKLTATESVKQAYAIKNETIPLRPNTDYTFVFEILENTLDNQAILLDSHGTCSFEAYQLIEAGVTGLYSYKVKSRETLTIERVLNITTTRKATSGYIKLRLTIYEGDVTKTVKGYVPFGLSSTEAIISNNGQQYPIYEPTIQGKTRILKATKGTQNWIEISPDETRDTATYDYKLDSSGTGGLGSTSSIYDYIDRARKVKIVNTFEGDADYLNNYDVVVAKYANTFRCIFEPIENLKPSASISVISNAIACKDYSIVTSDMEGIGVHNTNKALFIRIGIDKFPSVLAGAVPTKEELLTYLKTVNFKLRYQLATPIEIPLTDEELKAYDAYKKVISLPFAEDKMIIDETGNGAWINASKTLKITGHENWVSGYLSVSGTHMSYKLKDNVKPPMSVNQKQCVVDKYKYMCWIDGWYKKLDDIYVGFADATQGICISLPIDVAPDVETLKQYLIDTGGFEVRYLVDTPTTTHIPKELVPTILTNQTNILEVGGKVKPSSFKVTVPVDRIAELTARLEAVEAKTNTQPVNTAFVDETYAKSVNKIEEVIK